ncbi:MAG: hypothetical protein ACLFMP_04520 [Desulfonatronovibrionaceae bacterium]
MIHGDELIMLILGLGVLVFIRMNKTRVRRIPGYNTLVAAGGSHIRLEGGGSAGKKLVGF